MRGTGCPSTRDYCYIQIPKESRCGQEKKVRGWEPVQLIAIDYCAATGTAGMGSRETKDQRWPDSQSLFQTLVALWETQERGT